MNRYRSMKIFNVSCFGSDFLTIFCFSTREPEIFVIIWFCQEKAFMMRERRGMGSDRSILVLE